MTIVRFIGDVHGKYDAYKRVIKDVPFSIQVGDMGVGFMALRGGELKHRTNPPHYAMVRGRHLFIRGNHDNPSVCRRQSKWIPDGTYLDGKVFCVGGAVSVDRAYRTEGLDWWPDEELSIRELDAIVDEYVRVKPEIICTHDCPESVANDLMMAFNRSKFGDGSKTRQALESMLFHHQPRYWVFGHWHHSLTFKRGRTMFQCLNELEHVDIELEDFL